MSIIKCGGTGLRVHFLKEASKVMYFVCEFGLLLVELEKYPLRNEVTLRLDYWWISWPTTAYFRICDHWESQQGWNSIVGRSGCVTSNLEQGLNFTVNVDFWFYNDNFCKKPEDKKRDFCRFSMTSKTLTFVLVQIRKGIFQKALTFFAFIGYPYLKDILLNAHNWQLRQYSSDWESCNVLKQCGLVRRVLAGAADNGLSMSLQTSDFQKF